MAYDHPQRVSLDFDLGTTSFTRTFQLPTGFRGRVAAIFIQNTGTAYNAVTTSAIFALGVAGNASAYAAIPLGTLAANASIDASKVNGGIVRTPRSVAGIELPANTDILMTFTANTGGTPAGSARATAVLNYY